MIVPINSQVHTERLTYLPWPICVTKTLRGAKETTLHSFEIEKFKP